MPRIHRSAKIVDNKKYSDVTEASLIIDLSIPRIRQLIWSKEFVTEKKFAGKSFIERKELEEFVAKRRAKREARKELSERRLQARRIKALETVLSIVAVTPTVRKGLGVTLKKLKGSDS